MDGQFSSPAADKFELGKKWFWLGIVIAFLNVVAGLVYGIAVMTEGRRREGLIIVGWAIVWILISFFLIGPWLIKSGLLPRFQIIR